MAVLPLQCKLLLCFSVAHFPSNFAHTSESHAGPFTKVISSKLHGVYFVS